MLSSLFGSKKSSAPSQQAPSQQAPSQQAPSQQAPSQPAPSHPAPSQEQQKSEGFISRIKDKFTDIKNYIKSPGVSQQISESTKLFLEIVECTATLIPIFGPVIVLGAQVFQLPGEYHELKLKIIEFSSDIEEYQRSITNVIDELNLMYEHNIKKINSIKNDQTLKEQLKNLMHIVELIAMELEESHDYIQNKFDYNQVLDGNGSVAKDKTVAASSYNAIAYASPIKTIESKIDSFRISIISNMTLLLFEIQTIFITTITHITTQINETSEQLTKTSEQLTMNIETVKKLEKLFNPVKTDLIVVQNNYIEIQNNLKETIRETESNTNKITGGYKFKSKKIKRKLNKIKRKTKNNRKIKNKRKTKKYI
jgi:hypothetical protein